MIALALPSGLRARPLQPGDAGRWAELLRAVEEVDRRDEHLDADDCAEELADPELDLERDSLLVLDADGRPVAYQLLRMRASPPLGRRIAVDAAVHPSHRRRGIGTALTEAACRRADERGAAVVLRVAESNAGAVALAGRSGMRAVRWWSELERDLSAPIHPVPPPAGTSVAALGPGYDAARWDEPLRLAHNSAFADHWGSEPVSATAWAHQRTATRTFRPGCSAVALSGDGTIAGYVMSYEYAADTTRTGIRDLYVGTVGTLAAHRGRGVAAALLAHVLRAAREDGYATSSLTVDAENATGALGVYARAGYTLHRREITYLLPARP